MGVPPGDGSGFSACRRIFWRHGSIGSVGMRPPVEYASGRVRALFEWRTPTGGCGQGATFYNVLDETVCTHTHRVPGAGGGSADG